MLAITGAANVQIISVQITELSYHWQMRMLASLLLSLDSYGETSVRDVEVQILQNIVGIWLNEEWPPNPRTHQS
jgi:hypothetical protein